MEISNKSVIIAVIPVFLTVFGGLADNAVKWRSEMEQKKYDRQTRLIDKIMEIPKAEERLAMANFYLSIGVFDGNYKVELDRAVEQAKVELAENAANAASSEYVAEAAPTAAAAPSDEVYAEAIPEPTPEVVGIPNDIDWEQMRKELESVQTEQSAPQFDPRDMQQKIPSVFTIDR